jgi:hypothetical protein
MKRNMGGIIGGVARAALRTGKSKANEKKETGEGRVSPVGPPLAGPAGNSQERGTTRGLLDDGQSIARLPGRRNGCIASGVNFGTRDLREVWAWGNLYRRVLSNVHVVTFDNVKQPRVFA